MTLSLAMIVRDEAESLPRCLRSVAGLVDEIVVVDTGSRDATLQAASAAGARVAQVDWTDDFAAARNEALRLCTGDWVLQLDADEEIESGWHDGVRELLAAERGEVDCWLLRIVNLMSDKEPVSHHGTRLFRRLPQIRYDGRVHESIDHSVVASGLKVASTNVSIVHHGYASAETRRQKALRNMAIHEAQLLHGERPANLWYNLFNAAAQLGDAPAASLWLQLALADSSLTRPAQRAELLVRLYQNIAQTGTSHARHALDLALTIAPEQVLGWVLMAKHQANAGEFSEAINSLNRAMRVASGESCSQMSGDVILDVATLERWKGDVIEATSRSWRGSSTIPQEVPADG